MLLGFTDDDDGEFHRLDGFEIKANYETAARKYAKSNRISIEYLDGNKDLPYIITLIVVVISYKYCSFYYMNSIFIFKYIFGLKNLLRGLKLCPFFCYNI